MTISDTINEFISQALSKEQLYSAIGTVSNVNLTDRTCDVKLINGDGLIKEVRLQSVIGTNKGFVQIPKDASTVVVTFLNKATGFVSLCDEVDKILIDTDLVEFNGGVLGEMIVIDNLTSKLNLLVTELQAELIKIQASIVALGGAYMMGTLTSFNKDHYKNISIKQ